MADCTLLEKRKQTAAMLIGIMTTLCFTFNMMFPLAQKELSWMWKEYDEEQMI